MSTFYSVLGDGKFGIDSIRNGINAANSVYDLFEAVYLDDKKFSNDDIFDLIGKGPAVVQAVIKAAGTAKDIGKEALDLSEAEKAQIMQLSGSRINKPGYVKILRGVLDIVDGVGELKNPDNPVD